MAAFERHEENSGNPGRATCRAGRAACGGATLYNAAFAYLVAVGIEFDRKALGRGAIRIQFY